MQQPINIKKVLSTCDLPILKFHHVVKLKNTHNNNILLSKLLDNYLKNTDLKYNKYVKMPKLA